MFAQLHSSNEWDPSIEIADLTGKTALVTGANSPTGLGFNIAINLALRGAKTYVGARSTSKALDGITKMRDMFPVLRGSGLLRPFAVDLADLKAVKAAGHKFSETEKRLDILINNAAVVPGPADQGLNVYGVSVPFSINHLAPFVLTNELLPLIEKTARLTPGPRIINLASEAHFSVPYGVKFDTVASFNQDFGSGMARYGLSKLANILFTKELQRRFDSSKIAAISICLHPGGVRTDGAMGYVNSINMPELLDGSMTPALGAVTALFAAANPVVWLERGKYGGAYLTPYGVISEPSEDAQNESLATSLWILSETVLSVVGI